MTTPPSARHAAREDVPDVAAVGDLIGNVARDLSTLVRQELALARAELKQEAARTGRAAGALTGAGAAAGFAVLFLSLAVWAALASVMHPGWAALTVAVLWTGAATLLYAAGRARLRAVRTGNTRLNPPGGAR
ncbi:phage holin family protein [Pseudonocardia sp. TRM90224]|uniref:phage holin family protein n=1 Tax=Pseudonocardia sp. TRM90224 TaxID=2812678 RepID=UPI001E3E6773|nr:phage holin family protein [Pseudonocardia sp. TRM90224]